MYFHHNELQRIASRIGTGLLVLLTCVWLPVSAEPSEQSSELLQMGFQHLYEDEPETAIKKFDKILQDNPRHPVASYGKAASLLKLRQFDQVLTLLNQVLDQDPGDINALNLRAITYYNLHRFAQSIADFQAASQLNPDEGYFHECLSWAYLCAEQPEKASRAALRANALYTESGEDPSFSLLVAYLGFKLAGNDREAAKVLRFASDSMNPVDWPFPVIDYYAGTINEDGLIVEVGSLPQETEARTYIALKKIMENDRALALRHLDWIVKHGHPEVFEHTYAQVLFQRITEQQ